MVTQDSGSGSPLNSWLSYNPTTGCDQVSPGCDNCYAKGIAAVLKQRGVAKYQTDGDPRTSGPGFGLAMHPDALDIPLRRRKPSRYFVNSMSDVFHNRVTTEFILEIFDRMVQADQHTYMIITKRTRRMQRLLNDPEFIEETTQGGRYPWPLPNLWLGVSVETSKYNWRADVLRDTPAAIKFISAEPLLGELTDIDLTGIDWVSCGGETGPGARPANLDWYAHLRDRCADTGTLYNLHSLGEWLPVPVGAPARSSDVWMESEGSLGGHWVRHVGRVVAGRTLFGTVHNEHPDQPGQTQDLLFDA